ncbi:MAG TPA: helix-turn-helix domain-containing protein [Candidatus Mediterraneibacter merdipullorum]|nr:helix-turn-helix domain-containing protein [Candidatus Mediterraneibacter merdipullorum]
MAYSKANIASIIEKKRKNDKEFKKAWDDSREEYRLIGEMTALRKAEKITQSSLAEMTGSRQQVISRIEKRENSPSLGCFCNILNALGYELQIVKKGNTSR